MLNIWTLFSHHGRKKFPFAFDVNVLTDGMLLGMVGRRRYQNKPLVTLVRLSPGHTSWCYEVVSWYEYVLVRNK